MFAPHRRSKPFGLFIREWHECPRSENHGGVALPHGVAGDECRFDSIRPVCGDFRTLACCQWGGRPADILVGQQWRTKTMAQGTVKFFNTTKGFGFIQPDNGDKDVFVHISAVQKSGLEGLYENDKVTFELENGRDGKISATNLTLVE